jgi:hypothetical protein
MCYNLGQRKKMAKIILDVDEKQLTTVLNILKNLKAGLIQNIQTQKNTAKPVASSLKTANKQKYMSGTQYKQKQQEVLEDDFLASKHTSGKYLNPTQYKEKLRK